MQTNATEIMAHVVRSNPGIQNMVINIHIPIGDMAAIYIRFASF